MQIRQQASGCRHLCDRAVSRCNWCEQNANGVARNVCAQGFGVDRNIWQPIVVGEYHYRRTIGVRCNRKERRADDAHLPARPIDLEEITVERDAAVASMKNPMTKAMASGRYYENALLKRCHCSLSVEPVPMANYGSSCSKYHRIIKRIANAPAVFREHGRCHSRITRTPTCSPFRTV